MDTVSPALAARSAAPAPLLARPLSQDESVHLDRLRDWLRGDGTDARDSSALDARWARLLETHPPHVPAPAGVAAAIGIAVGDLLVASVADAVWMMCPGPEGATPGVLLPERPNTPVLPVLDAHARWRVRTPAWTVDYVERAAAHLRSVRPQLPQPHPAPDATSEPLAVDDRVTPTASDVEAPAEHVPDVEPAAEHAPDVEPAVWTPTFVAAQDDLDPAPAAEPVAAAPTPGEEPQAPEAEPAAWTPRFVEDTRQTSEPAGWTPTFVEDPAPEPAAWTPTFVEDAPQDPEPAAWAPTSAEDASGTTEPAAWTPTFVEDPTPEPAAWAPTLVEDPAPPSWAPTDVQDDPSASAAPTPSGEPLPWTPRLVEDPAPETTDLTPATSWTTAGVEDVAPEPTVDPAAWSPTLVDDIAPDAAPIADAPPAPTTSSIPVPALPPASVTPSVPVPVVPAYPTPGLGLPVAAQQPLTPEDLPHRPSERVQDLALRALELALDRAVRDAAGSAPFVLVREGYDVEVVEFEHSDAGVAQAREAAREGGYSAAAVAWTSPADASRPYPRVVVDASAAGRPGLRVAHSFAHDEHGGREIGGPQVVGQSPPVL